MDNYREANLARVPKAPVHAPNFPAVLCPIHHLPLQEHFIHCLCITLWMKAPNPVQPDVEVLLHDSCEGY